ncbi:MAG: autotransporter outer membrane beta-barrel domain-containing protein [Gammaproteobacteria bacterium]
MAGSFPALTENQASLASALAQLCPSTTSSILRAQCTALQALTPAEQSNAIAQLTPDQLAAQGSTMVELSNFQLGNISSRIESLKRGSSGLASNGALIQVASLSLPLGLLADSALAAATTTNSNAWANDRFGAFFNGRIAFGSLDTTANETGFSLKTYGATAGMDYRVAEQLVLGGSLGYAATTSDFDAQRGNLKNHNLMLSFYGSYYTPTSYYMDWIASYASGDYDLKRNIVYTGLNTSTQGSVDGNQYDISVNVGDDLNRGSMLLSPYIRLEYINTQVNSFTEHGGSGWALSYQDQSIQSVTTSLGGRVSWALSQSWGVLTPGISADWEHQYQNNSREITVRFAADPSVPFTINTDSPDRDYVNLGASLAATFPGSKAVFISYEAVLGQQHVTFSSVNFGARMEF